MDFITPSTSQEWDHTVFVLLWLRYFTLRNVFKVHLCSNMCKNFLFLKRLNNIYNEDSEMHENIKSFYSEHLFVCSPPRCYFFFFFFLFRAALTACGGSQARGPIGVTAVSLHHSSRQCQILNLSEARDWTCNLMVPSRICFRWATMGTPLQAF